MVLFFLVASPIPAHATDSLRPWREYRTILWVGDSAYKDPRKTALFFQRLHEIGVNTAMIHGDGPLGPLLENHFPYYVENIVNRGLCLKWNSSVTNWEQFVTAWAKTGRPESALIRDFCLDDPAWLSTARAEMQTAARKNAPHNPVAYNIRDELSTTISANPFDYDFNPIALAGFRAWLKTQYTNLAALNSEWQTHFSTWNEIKPFTTDAIKNRMASGDAMPRGKPDWQALQRIQFDPGQAAPQPTRWNFSPWADFRTYMDLSLARALDQLRQAAHAVDSHTPVGIEGTQMPHAFGGYDLWRLSQVVDWVEPYDVGNAREILGSFMPHKPILTTVFEKDTNHARRRLWHLLLEGDRGCLIWWSEDCFDWKSVTCEPTAKALALAPVLKELTGPLARLFLLAEPEYDLLLLHYSQPSIQVDWLLESTIDGSTWLRRFSSFEADHNHMAMARNAWLKLFQDLGYSPRFISSREIENGALPETGPAALVLSRSFALSDREASRISSFLAQASNQTARVVFSDGIPGLFDQHGKFRAVPLQLPFANATNALAKILAAAGNEAMLAKTGDIATHAVQRLNGHSEWLDWLGTQLRFLPKSISYDPNACVRLHRYRLPNARLLAFERNVDYHMSEDLQQAGGNESLEIPLELEVRFADTTHLYDLRSQVYLGYTNRLWFTIDPWQPSLFAQCSNRIPAENVLTALQPQ